MPSSRKKIPPKTRRVLDIRSLNQCAYPDCTNTLVEPGIGRSEPTVTGDVCHIHAVSPGGPRWKEGLTKKELNSPANLIFLCKHHHGIVDGQHEYYTAEMLWKWKREHEARETRNLSGDLDFVRELVDGKIKAETDKLRQSRFFEEFDEVGFSLTLARKLVKEEFLVGSNVVRCQALAWCVRILASECQDKAEKYLTHAKELGTGPESIIAEAFLSAQKGDKAAALAALAEIDSPISRSAALIIVARCESRQDAIDWLKATDIDARNLDPDGKRTLIAYQLSLNDWTAAHESLDLLTDDDLREAPVLYHLVALTHLLTTVPEEIRSAVLVNPPFDIRDFRFDSSEQAIGARKRARHHFVIAHEVADQLNLPRAAAMAEEYALWLELSDPDESDNGRKRLATKLHDLKDGLRFVRFGVQSGIKLDLEAIEREIERQTAVNGKITHDAALARFGLAFCNKTPGEVASYLTRHKDELSGHISSKLIMSIQVDAFSQAGQVEKAKNVLNLLIEEGIAEAEVYRHRQMIAESVGADPVEGHRKLFRQTNSLTDLANLVEELRVQESWDDLCVYGEKLFQKTTALVDAERYALALYKTYRNAELAGFLESNTALLSQSRRLQLLYCDSLLFAGALLKARTEMDKLTVDWQDRDYRSLRMDLAASMGDTHAISEIVAYVCMHSDGVEADELIVTAKRAECLDLPRVQVRTLVQEAVKKGNDDADVLAAAYLLATRIGWDDEEVFQWLQRAAELSGPDGPVKSVTLKDLLDRKPERDRQQSDLRQQLLHGEIPMYLAGDALNRTLIDLMLHPSLANPEVMDPRHRIAVPAYYEKRKPSSLSTRSQVGLDMSALLTLGYLDLLEKALDAFDTVHIPHTTLDWLLIERRNRDFHQKTLIREARQISELMSRGAIEKLKTNATRDTSLSDQIGDELAQLIAEAERGRDLDESQYIVVRSYPIHRIASLIEHEEVDLTDRRSILSSCHGIVEYLRKRGGFTTPETKRARAYLRLHDQPWPEEPKIRPGAVLYLDEEAVGHLLHLKILGKLRDHGLRPIVSPEVVSRANQLLDYEEVCGGVIKIIEHIRSSISSRIKSGKVKAGRRIKTDQSAAPSVTEPEPEHPTLGLFFLSAHCNAIIADDRCLGQHPSIEVSGQETPLFTTLDLIDALVSSDKITAEERLHHRTRLRQAGYIFVPVDVDELIYHLDDASVENGELIETAELKAIRENLLLVRLNNCNLSVEENDWPGMLFKTFRETIKELWKRGGDLSDIQARSDWRSDVQARSDWILSQFDIRIWTHCFERETGEGMIGHGYRVQIMSLLLLSFEGLQDVKEDYWRWIEDRVLGPIKEQSPELYLELVEWYRRNIASMFDKYATESRGNGKQP